MLCWWCCHPVEGESLAMPHRYDDRRRRFHTAGHFCSWSCMKSYAIDKYGECRGGLICGNITLMRKRMFNQLGQVRRAPNRYRLDVFGGDMTIRAFREHATCDDRSTANAIDTKPFVDTMLTSVVDVPMVPAASKNETTTLKLKRTKPLKRNHNNLESMLGLVITVGTGSSAVKNKGTDATLV